MVIDPDTANWVLEFFLRQPLEDRSLNSMLQAMPLPDDKPNLKKLLLLKQLESELSRHSVSESTLELLEQLEEVEFRQGNETVSDAMKRAYCAAAVECTVKIFKDGDDADEAGKRFNFFQVVKRVWRGRIRRMKEVVEKGGLGSEQLEAWEDEIEAAVWDDGVCKRVVEKGEGVNAAEAVDAYIKEERERMGPSFLELVAECVKTDKVLQGVLGVVSIDQVDGKEAPASGVDGAVGGSNASKEMLKEKIKLRDKLVGVRRTRGSKRGTSGGAKIVDPQDMVSGPSEGRYNILTSAEVNKVREALETSSSELHAVVKDPLPDALKVAEAISGEARNNNRQIPAEGNDVTDNHIESSAFVVDDAGVVHTTNGNIRNVQRPSLMERNSSARTYEWEDSIDTSHEESSPRNVAHLPTPRKIETSPLDKCESTHLKRRRKGRRWTLLEEDTLRDGVEKYGKGNWKYILTVNRDIFEGRTEVDLKDKWRNLIRY